MTYKKQQGVIDKLQCILMQSFVFNGIKICVNYVSRAKHSENWIIKVHCHPWFEFNYVSKGSVYTTISDSEFLVEAGQSYIIPPGVKHSHRNNKTGDDGICIRFSLDVQEHCLVQKNMLDALFAPHPYAFNSNIDKLVLKGNVYAVEAEFISWIMKFSDLWITADNSISNNFSNILAHQVILYLNEYYNTKINVCDIANALNMSYRNLSRKFKTEAQMTISEKITEIRIENAKNLLLNSKMSMYEIAVAVGFENEFYFSKKFKQYEKISPIQYKKALQKNMKISGEF